MVETVDVGAALAALVALEGRTPDTDESAARESFRRLADYRDGGVFVAAFSGRSEWERHGNGDEIVYAAEGQAELILLVDGREQRRSQATGALVVVARGTWHRFETAGVKLLTVTPQPTDHHREAGLPLAQ